MVTARHSKKAKISGLCQSQLSRSKKDLVTQSNFLSLYSDEIITDLGSGLNCKKTGLRKLLALLLDRQISTLHLTHTDRLLRFGHELVFQICRWAGTDVVIHNAPKVMSFEEELCQDVLTLMAVFSGRLHGKRSHQHKKLHPTP
jgi:predicted site-specific integrase-resolvase